MSCEARRFASRVRARAQRRLIRGQGCRPRGTNPRNLCTPQPWESSRVTDVYGVIVVNYSTPVRYIATTGGKNVVLPMEAWMSINEALGTGGIFNYLRWRSARQNPLPMLFERELLAEQLIQEAMELPPRHPDLDPREDAWAILETTYPNGLRSRNPEYRWARVVDALIAAGHDLDPHFGVVASPYDYLGIAEVLERLHPDTKIELGQRILEKCRLAYEQNRRRYFVMEDGEEGVIVFVSDPAPRQERRKFLKFLTIAAHTLMMERGYNAATRTVGFSTEPYPSAGRSHDLMFVRANFDLDEKTRGLRDELLSELVGPPRPVDHSVLNRLDDPVEPSV